MNYRFVVALVGTMSLVACGGGGGGESGFDGLKPDSSFNNPPDVTGTYYCQSGCGSASSDTCYFSTQIEITQQGSLATSHSDMGSSMEGVVDDDGNFEALDSESCSCAGHFGNGVIQADCTCDGGDCQRVTYREI